MLKLNRSNRVVWYLAGAGDAIIVAFVLWLVL